MRITLRPETADDEPLLYELYRNLRAAEVAAFGWDAAQQDAFLKMQFKARQQQYDFQYADGEHGIVVEEGRGIGRLLVLRSESEIRLVDIALLPGRQGSGIGSRLIQRLLDEGDGAGKPVTLHVEKDNPALRLYERMGFVKVRETGDRFFMEKVPERHAGKNEV